MPETSAQLLVCDGAGRRLEDLLPQFRELGYTCTYVADTAALELGSSTPDLILLSAEIPGGAHGAPFRRVRDRFGGSPIVVVAHVRSLSTAIEFFRAGVADYLPVPFSSDEARIRLDEALLRPIDTPVEPCDYIASAPDIEIDIVPGAPQTVPQDRKAVPQNLSEAEDTLYDVLPCGVLLLDAAGRLTHANEAALGLFGVATEAELRAVLESRMPDYKPQDLHGKEVAPDSWPLRRALRDKTPRAATVSLQRPDHTRMWLRIEAKPHLERGRVLCVAVTCSNVTEECAALRRLREERGSALLG